MERINRNEDRLAHRITIFVIRSIVAVLFLLGLIGLMFIIVFCIALLLFVFTGEVGLGLRYWLPGLMTIFLIVFKFPKYNVFWERIFKI